MTKPALLALVALLTGAVDAQTPAPSAGRQFSAAPESFDAASIKPHVAGARPAIRVTPSGIDFVNASLREIVQTAYQILPQQISTMSDLSARYDIVARAGVRATREQVMTMLRTLLADRFRIRAHHEQREAQVFALVVAKGGPRLTLTKPDSDAATALPTPSGAALGITALAVPGGMRFVSSSISDLALYLSRTPMGRPVVDETGLAGPFDFTFQIAPPNDPAAEASVRSAIAEGDPTVWTDALDRLGLKLESKRRQINMLVIDSVERLREN